MNDGRRDARNHETVYRVVGGPGGADILYEHAIIEVTPTEVHVERRPVDEQTLGFYQTRQGTYVLDRQELEKRGHYDAPFGPARHSFYLNRADVEGPVERPSELSGEEDSSEADLRSVPANALQAEVVKHFEQVASVLEGRYAEGFSQRVLLEIALRQTLVDFQVHGKDSPLVQQIDSISIRTGLDETGSGPDLQPLPVDQMQADVVRYLEKAIYALRSRYEEDFSGRHFLEVALRQMFADLRIYQHEATVVLWLDVLLRRNE